MPTETDPAPPPSPDLIDTRLRPNPHASCPPEEIREGHAPREERLEAVGVPSTGRTERSSTDEQAGVRQQPTPEPDNQASRGANDKVDASRTDGKGGSAGDAGAMAMETLPSPTTTPPSAPLDGDAQDQTQATVGDDASAPSPPPLYLNYGRDTPRECPVSTTSFLRPGSRFKGTQKSDRQVYDVQVELKDVNMAESFLCGYLRIQGLTDDHPTLTTFFESEIIGPKHLFRTVNPSWGSSEKTDLQHWARFPAWRPLAKSAKSPNFTLKNPFAREHIFMRWKEYFLVPDHRVRTITGASFEGFYYICFDQRQGTVSGIYFHSKSEKYQQLELKHVDDGGCMSAIEFR